MGLQSAALEIVLSNFEEDLTVGFFDSMVNIMELHKALRSDGAGARLRRIGVTHTAVLEAKVVAWVRLATLCGRLNDELRTRDESDYLAYFLMSDLNDPLNEYYVYDNGNYELRHRTTVELQAESDEVHEELQTLADIFGFDEGYDSEDPDFADGSLALARCRVWAGL